MFRLKPRWTAATIIATAVATGALVSGGTAYAVQAVTSSITPKPLYACEGSGHVTVTPLSTPSSSCPADTTSIVVGAAGAAGPAGPQGPAGSAGPRGNTGSRGPSGVQALTTNDLGGKPSIATGGSFVSNATDAGEVSLPAGTYLISVNAKATPLMTSGVQVFPQFFVYDQAANSSFTGDLFNVGSGALESGGNVNIDSYFSGSDTITLSHATTLHIYAFGYDSDRGAGSYTLDDVSVTTTQLTPAS